jgi:predicted ATPase
MLINSIKLSNFKNFEDVEVKLGKMNVIVGANASGKSNFLQALKFLRDIKDFGIDNAISMQGGIEYLRNMQLKKNKVTKISISFIPFSDNDGTASDGIGDNIILQHNLITYSIEIATKTNKKHEIINEEIIYNSSIRTIDFDRLGVVDEKYAESVFKGKAIRNVKFVLTLKKDKISFSNSIKDEEIVIQFDNNTTKFIKKDDCVPFQLSMIRFYVHNHNSKTLIERFTFFSLVDFLNFPIYDFDLKKAKQSTPITGKSELEENGENLALVLENILVDKDTQRQFSNLLTDILPFVKGLNTEKFYDKSLSFKIQEIYNASSHLPSSLLSDGTIAVTAMIVALFFEHKNLAIFEEPEHGVHPALIAKLMQNFYDASEKKQVIITTHSPEILKHIKNLDDLLFVSRNEKGFGQITKPIEQEMVKAFLENELGIDQLFTQNLLDN